MALLLVLLTCAPLALASKGDGEERRVEVQANSEGFAILLERESNPTQDRLEVSFQLDDAEFQVRYEAVAEDAATDIEIEAEFEVVGEFRDTNGNGQFDAGEPMVSGWGISSDGDQRNLSENGKVEWGFPVVSDEAVEGKTGKRIAVAAAFGRGGRLEFRFHAFGDSLTLQGDRLRPTSVKIDFVVENYPYHGQDTAPVLVVDTKAETGSRVEHDRKDLGTGNDGFVATATVRGKPVTLAFVWHDTAAVDGVSKTVGSTVANATTETERDGEEIETMKEERWVLSYARGTRIAHDSESYLSTGGGGGWIPFPSGTALVVASTLVALFLRGDPRR